MLMRSQLPTSITMAACVVITDAWCLADYHQLPMAAVVNSCVAGVISALQPSLLAVVLWASDLLIINDAYLCCRHLSIPIQTNKWLTDDGKPYTLQAGKCIHHTSAFR